jgi:DNA-binding ferritin-like protein
LSKKYSRPETRRNVGANQPSYESKQRSLNKKLEKYLVRVMDIFDNIFEINERLSKEEKQPIQNLNTILLKAASIESENINDEIKAKFLYRVIREYRQIVEMNR